MNEYIDIPKSETSTDTVLAYSVPIIPNEGYVTDDAIISCSNAAILDGVLTISNVQTNQTCKVQFGKNGPFNS